MPLHNDEKITSPCYFISSYEKAEHNRPRWTDPKPLLEKFTSQDQFKQHCRPAWSDILPDKQDDAGNTAYIEYELDNSYDTPYSFSTVKGSLPKSVSSIVLLLYKKDDFREYGQHYSDEFIFVSIMHDLYSFPGLEKFTLVIDLSRFTPSDRLLEKLFRDALFCPEKLELILTSNNRIFTNTYYDLGYADLINRRFINGRQSAVKIYRKTIAALLEQQHQLGQQGLVLPFCYHTLLKAVLFHLKSIGILSVEYLRENKKDPEVLWQAPKTVEDAEAVLQSVLPERCVATLFKAKTCAAPVTEPVWNHKPKLQLPHDYVDELSAALKECRFKPTA